MKLKMPIDVCEKYVFDLWMHVVLIVLIWWCKYTKLLNFPIICVDYNQRVLVCVHVCVGVGTFVSKGYSDVYIKNSKGRN